MSSETTAVSMSLVLWNRSLIRGVYQVVWQKPWRVGKEKDTFFISEAKLHALQLKDPIPGYSCSKMPA